MIVIRFLYLSIFSILIIHRIYSVICYKRNIAFSKSTIKVVDYIGIKDSKLYNKYFLLTFLLLIPICYLNELNILTNKEISFLSIVLPIIFYSLVYIFTNHSIAFDNEFIYTVGKRIRKDQVSKILIVTKNNNNLRLYITYKNETLSRLIQIDKLPLVICSLNLCEYKYNFTMN